MEWFAKAFIRASLLWFAAGIVLGLANLGLAGLVAGFFFAPNIGSAGMTVTAIGGALWAIGAFGFIYNMWRTFDAAERRRRLNARQPERRNLPMQ